jgi:hypothetical protein
MYVSLVTNLILDVEYQIHDMIFPYAVTSDACLQTNTYSKPKPKLVLSSLEIQFLEFMKRNAFF